MIKAVILVGIGGGIGSILRYLTSVFFTRYFQISFPLGIFAVNVIGCLVAGILLGLLTKHQSANSDLSLLLITGFCGGYTTFSAFASENINLIQSNNSLTAFIYIAASILFSLSAVWAGMALTR